jgi:hypothetical protein
MDQNPVGFPNSMYPHFGPYTPYFGPCYGGVRVVPTMWPFMSNPLANPTISPKLVSRIVQARIVTNCKGPLDEDEDYSERKHNPRMPQIISTKKPYHDWRGRPS